MSKMSCLSNRQDESGCELQIRIWKYNPGDICNHKFQITVQVRVAGITSESVLVMNSGLMERAPKLNIEGYNLQYALVAPGRAMRPVGRPETYPDVSSSLSTG